MVLLTPGSALLTLIAVVASIDGGRAVVEGELVRHLRPADVGRVQYEITVGSVPKTIAVGTAEVVSVENGAAEVRLTSDRQVLPGFEVRFEVPSERLRAARQRARDQAEALQAAEADLAAAVVEKERLSARVAELESRLANTEAARSTVRAVRPATAALPTRALLEARVLAWAEAWSSRDLPAYLSFYSADYAPEGTSRQQWEARRSQRLRAPKFIQITVGSFELLSATNERAEVRFVQSYRSNTYEDRVIKNLQLTRVEGEWKITREE